MGSWEETNWFVVDVEGNGGHPPEIVELAIVPIIGGEIGAAQAWLLRPPTKINWLAQRVHGIANDDVAGCPALQEVADDILAALAPADVVVGHQAHVDIDILSRVLPEWRIPATVDTIRMSRRLFPNQMSHGLVPLSRSFGLGAGVEGKAHRAGYDATVTARLFLRLISTMSGDPSTGDILQLNPMPIRPAPMSRLAVPGQGEPLFEL
jgi:DNA polymerase III epsilon subunit-like protein